MRWSENQTYHFVKQYMRHENLWNSKHEHYKVSNMRIKSYKEIISQFRDITGIDMNIAELKLKIKSLRSTYMQEVAKIKRRSGPDRTYRSNLKWFPIWHNYFVNSSNEQHDDGYIYQQDYIDNQTETWVSQTDNSSDSSPVDPSLDDEDYNIKFKVEPSDSFTTQESTKRSKTRKRKFKRHSLSTEISDESFLNNKNSSVTRKDDEFDIYGKYIAAQLRDMELQEALRIQLEIQSIVSAARITLLEKE